MGRSGGGPERRESPSCRGSSASRQEGLRKHKGPRERTATYGLSASSLRFLSQRRRPNEETRCCGRKREGSGRRALRYPELRLSLQEHILREKAAENQAGEDAALFRTKRRGRPSSAANEPSVVLQAKRAEANNILPRQKGGQGNGAIPVSAFDSDIVRILIRVTHSALAQRRESHERLLLPTKMSLPGQSSRGALLPIAFQGSGTASHSSRRIGYPPALPTARPSRPHPCPRRRG